MFRECYFEYAGQSSQPYNLMLCYVSNSNTDFDSGGSFDLKTDTLPYFHETLLYGKDYSAQPLEFDIEFMNLNRAIPFEQMVEIKNWLFGQDGWKTFRCLDDRQDYVLKCIFEPSEDIIDDLGYRGIRCKLRNASPFWYGDEKEITIKNSKLTAGYDPPSEWFGWNNFEVDIPIGDAVDCAIYPKVIINTNKTSNNMYAYGNYFRLANTDVDTLADGYAKTSDGKHYLHKETSRIAFDNTYLENTLPQCTYSYSYDNDNDKHYLVVVYDGVSTNYEISDVDSSPTDAQIDSTLRHAGYHSLTYDSESKSGTGTYAKDVLTVDTRYVTFRSAQCPDASIAPIVNFDLPVPIFRLHYGKNICRIYYGYAYDSITFRYTPLYRMGAF